MTTLHPIIPQSKAFLDTVQRLKQAFFTVNVYDTANEEMMFVVRYDRETYKNTHITQAIDCFDDLEYKITAIHYDATQHTITITIKTRTP